MFSQPSTVTGLSLSELLDRADAKLVKLSSEMTTVPPDIFKDMDDAFERLKEAEALGNTLPAERSQFNYLVKKIEKNGAFLLRILGGKAALEKLRQERQPLPEQSWWFIDQILEDQRRRSLRRTLIISGGVLLVLVILALVYKLFLAPSPAVTQKLDSMNSGYQLLQSGDPASALVEVEKGLALNPSDPELLTFKVILYEKLGQNDKAADTAVLAEKAAGSRDRYLLFRASLLIQMNEAQAALEDATEAVGVNPQSAEGYFYIAKANEILGNFEAAVNAYTQSQKLAEAQGKTELVATIRVSLAMLYQTKQ